MVASPFVLYFAWQYLHGEFADLRSIFGRRQSFKRHLQVATLNPRDAQAHYELGLIHKQRREFAEAAERFKTAAGIDPTDVDSHYQLGRMAREQAQYEDAIRHFEEVVRRDAAYARHEIWREIGATYVASTSWANARWALEKYTAERPHDPEGLVPPRGGALRPGCGSGSAGGLSAVHRGGRRHAAVPPRRGRPLSAAGQEAPAQPDAAEASGRAWSGGRGCRARGTPSGRSSAA